MRLTHPSREKVEKSNGKGESRMRTIPVGIPHPSQNLGERFPRFRLEESRTRPCSYDRGGGERIESRKTETIREEPKGGMRL